MKPLDFPEEEKKEEPPKTSKEYWLSPIGNIQMGLGILGFGAIVIIGTDLVSDIILFSVITLVISVGFVALGLARFFWEGFTEKDRGRNK